MKSEVLLWKKPFQNKFEKEANLNTTVALRDGEANPRGL